MIMKRTTAQRTLVMGTTLLMVSACGSSDNPQAASPSMQPPSDASARPDSSAVETLDSGNGQADASDGTSAASKLDATCQTNGCIRELTKVGAYAKELLTPAIHASNPIENGFTQYFVRYMSDSDEITSSVFVPDTQAPSQGYPIAVLNQFTTGVGAPCAPSKGILATGVGSPTALRGFVTIVPDAPSYGPPPYGVFLAAKPSGRAALDAARVALQLGEVLGTPVARQVIIAGFSQGGHSTMAAATEFASYAPELPIKGFAATAPPANFRSGCNNVFRTGKGFGIFLAMRLWTWHRTYQLGGEPIFKEPYRSQAETIFAQDCMLNGADATLGQLATRFPADPNVVMNDAYLDMGKNDSWPEGWAKLYEESTPIPKGIKIPILILQGTKDETVPKVDTDLYVSQLRDAKIEVDYRIIEGTAHETTALSPLTVEQKGDGPALQWIRERLKD